MPMDWMWPAGWLAMLFVWLLIVAVIVIGLVLVVRAVRGPGPNVALQILEEQFARGEIGREEFEERRRTLRS